MCVASQNGININDSIEKEHWSSHGDNIYTSSLYQLHINKTKEKRELNKNWTIRYKFVKSVLKCIVFSYRIEKNIIVCKAVRFSRLYMFLKKNIYIYKLN